MKARFFPSQSAGINTLMRDFLNNDWPLLNADRDDMWSPSANIAETDDEWRIELMVPGMKKEDFHLEVEQNKLTVSAEIKESAETLKYNYREFHKRSFKRRFNLPEGKIDEAAVTAAYNEGILVVTLPKLEEAKQRGPRTIEIR